MAIILCFQTLNEFLEAKSESEVEEGSEPLLFFVHLMNLIVLSFFPPEMISIVFFK